MAAEKYCSDKPQGTCVKKEKGAPPPSDDRKSTSNTALSRLFERKEQRLAREEAAKVDNLYERLCKEGRPEVPKELVREAVTSNYAASCPGNTYDLVTLRIRSDEGWIAPYDPSVTLYGAENRSNVTCYIDSLLFAIFIKMDAYESMLKPSPTRRPEQKRLADAIRLWVNMVRLGKLVHTDQTARLQKAMVECGWIAAGKLRQQDTSEAFGFITEALELPLLTFEVDLFHHGIEDDRDHKVVHERLINVSVPVPSELAEGQKVTLEDCLEDYFNTQVDVQRDSGAAEKEPTKEPVHIALETDICSSSNGLRETITGPLHEILDAPLRQRAQETDNTPPEEPPGLIDDDDDDDDYDDAEEFEQHPKEPFPTVQDRFQPPNRPRRSTIERVVLNERGQVTASGADSPTTLHHRAEQPGSTLVKAIAVPAWQFYRLIPFSTTTPNTTQPPSTDHEVFTNLHSRPVVGICLKRYLFENGQLRKHNTMVDIPLSMKLPHFISTPEDPEDDPALGQQLNEQGYKLVLQSVVCHRGSSMNCGHYISFARTTPKNGEEEEQWVRFDDLAKDGRVQRVGNIKTVLQEEIPYLVFYQIVPTNEEVSHTVSPPPSNASLTMVAPTSSGKSNQVSTTDKSDTTTMTTPEGTSPISTPTVGGRSKFKAAAKKIKKSKGKKNESEHGDRECVVM